jgi:sulfate adenylyltransferase
LSRLLERSDESESVETRSDAYGGRLVDLLVPPERAAELKALSTSFPSWDLTDRQLCDLELLLNGAFSPLTGFMGREAYESVCLDVTEEAAAELRPGQQLALRDSEGVMLAVLHVDELFRPDRGAEARLVFGTTDTEHPGVSMLLQKTNPIYVAGTVEGIQLPTHYDFHQLRLTPRQVRAEIARRGWDRVVAFQTRNPMHRAHQELTLRAAATVNAKILIHPVVGMTKPGDVDHYTRVRCYEALFSRYPHGSAMLSLLPLAMRMGGPREVVLHAIVRKNYGATHLIVGRDHAGPGKRRDGTPFYGPYEAQEVLGRHADEIGIEMVPFAMLVYVAERDAYFPEDAVPDGLKPVNISGTELRQRLASGEELPSWFTFPEVAAELRRTHRPRLQQGFTVFFTGLSGAGKSTVANVLQVKLLERGGRSLSMLDGDLVRKNLSSELGFSREHRDLNIRRIGYVAAEITKAGGVAICAPIAPYDATRKQVRAMVEPVGGFVLVHIAAAIEVCEARDRKGLYAKARAGLVKEFTGVSDPYEAPTDAELVLDTSVLTPEESADRILAYLEQEGYVEPINPDAAIALQ